MDNHYILKVVREDKAARKYYVIYNNNEWPVDQVPEQIGKPTPDTIECVLTYDSKGSVMKQYWPALIRKHYKENDEQIFTVVSVDSVNVALCDHWGYTAYAKNEANFTIANGQKLRCTVLKIDGAQPLVKIIEIADEKSNGLTFGRGTLQHYANESHDDLFSLLLTSNTTSFDLQCIEFIENELTKNRTKSFDAEHHICMTLYEGSNLIKNCTESERHIIKDRLNTFIEHLDFFDGAMRIKVSNSPNAHIESLLKKLRDHGTLYNARTKLHQMLFLFVYSPSLLECLSNNLFETIEAHDIDWWQSENLDNEWIVVLQYYCNQLLKTEFTSFLQNSFSYDTHQRTAHLVQALALQQNLLDGNESTLINNVINRSQLYRLCSEMAVAKPSELLELSFKNLMEAIDCPLYFDKKSLGNADLIANMVYNLSQNAEEQPYPPYLYEGEKASLRITQDGAISIFPNDVIPDSTHEVLPKELAMWHGLQVRVPNKTQGYKTDNITSLDKMWNDVETQLFNRELIYKSKSSLRRTQYHIGERVGVVVRRVEYVESVCVLHCDIVEPTPGSHARIDLSDIVHYYVKDLNTSHFCIDGKPMILRAEIVNISNNGVYQVSMLQQVEDFIANYHYSNWQQDPDYTIACRVAHYNGDRFKRYIGISDMGFPISVNVADEVGTFTQFRKYDTILVDNTDSELYNGFIQGEFLEHIPANEVPAKTCDMFSNLMMLYCQDNVYEENSDAEDANDNKDEARLTDSEMAELIAIIEQQAVIEDDYIKAFNYFAICHSASRILGDERMASYYQGRMKLIRMLCQFADTDRLDDEVFQTEQIDEQLFNQNSKLQYGLTQLRLVACLDRSDRLGELSRIRENTKDDDLKRLATLVMAHNLLSETGSTTEAASVRQQVRQLLRLRTNETDKKFYGEENQQREFKTSMVFPPDNNLMPNIEKQTNEILQQICAFLNSGGGILYIGVNNEGYECGLKNDINYTRFKGSKDAYTVYFDNMVSDRLGETARRFVDREFDPETKSDVLIVTVHDCDTPIALNNTYYERRGTSVRHIEDKERFLIHRQKQIASQRQYAANGNNTSAATPAQTDEKTATQPSPTAVAEKNIVSWEEESTIDTEKLIATSKMRNNVLHDYEEDYIPDNVGYICLHENDTYHVQIEEVWDDYPLTLVVHETEMHGTLLCLFDDSTYTNTPLDQLFERRNNHEFVREPNPLLATIATDDDTLITIVADSKRSRYIRFNSVKELKKSGMNDRQDALCDGNFEKLVLYEVVPTEKLSSLDLHPRNDRSLGIAVKSSEGREICNLLALLGIAVD